MAGVLGLQEMLRRGMSHPIARRPRELGRGSSAPSSVSGLGVGLSGGSWEPLILLLFGRGSLPRLRAWDCRFGLMKGWEWGPTWGHGARPVDGGDLSQPSGDPSSRAAEELYAPLLHQ